MSIIPRTEKSYEVWLFCFGVKIGAAECAGRLKAPKEFSSGLKARPPHTKKVFFKKHLFTAVHLKAQGCKKLAYCGYSSESCEEDNSNGIDYEITEVGTGIAFKVHIAVFAEREHKEQY